MVMTKYEFDAPDELDEEQVKYLKECNIIVTKRQKGKNYAIWIFNPKIARSLKKQSLRVR